jgi:uncharacterized protein YcsI (UPF0317 family)
VKGDNSVEKQTDLSKMHPREVRGMIRENILKGRTTIGACDGYVQAGMAIVPEKHAFDFLRFCERNPRPCNLIGVISPGSPHPEGLAEDADIRTDLIRYKVFKNGKRVAEVDDIKDLWRSDLVTFFIGGSLSFDKALIDAGIDLLYRRGEARSRVFVYISNIACRPAGIFSGPMVVSMRPIPGDRVAEVVSITSRFPKVHGAPVYIGDPSGIGIDKNIEQVMKRYDLGSLNSDLPELPNTMTPVFWGCSVTPQAAAVENKMELMITHGPGTPFIADLRNDELSAF